MAADALNGPVDVAPHAEGATVTYTNETEFAQNCGGFTMPFTTVTELGISTDALDVTDINSARSLFQAIDNEGDVSIMVNTEDGTFQPQVLVVGVDQHASSFVPAYAAFMGQGVPIEAGESLTWEAPAPED